MCMCAIMSIQFLFFGNVIGCGPVVAARTDDYSHFIELLFEVGHARAWFLESWDEVQLIQRTSIHCVDKCQGYCSSTITRGWAARMMHTLEPLDQLNNQCMAYALQNLAYNFFCTVCNNSSQVITTT